MGLEAINTFLGKLMFRRVLRNKILPPILSCPNCGGIHFKVDDPRRGPGQFKDIPYGGVGDVDINPITCLTCGTQCLEYSQLSCKELTYQPSTLSGITKDEFLYGQIVKGAIYRRGSILVNTCVLCGSRRLEIMQAVNEQRDFPEKKYSIHDYHAYCACYNCGQSNVASQSWYLKISPPGGDKSDGRN